MDIEALHGAMAPAIGRMADSTATHGRAAAGEKFSDWLKHSFQQINSLQQSADHSARQVITGESEDVAGAMIQMEKANLTFNFVMQVRNKIVSAYEEIQRMQL